MCQIHTHVDCPSQFVYVHTFTVCVLYSKFFLWDATCTCNFCYHHGWLVMVITDKLVFLCMTSAHIQNTVRYTGNFGTTFLSLVSTVLLTKHFHLAEKGWVCQMCLWQLTYSIPRVASASIILCTRVDQVWLIIYMCLTGPLSVDSPFKWTHSRFCCWKFTNVVGSDNNVVS